jgi:hypothetical protein
MTKLNTKAGINSLKMLFRSTFKEKRKALHHIEVSYACTLLQFLKSIQAKNTKQQHLVKQIEQLAN